MKLEHRIHVLFARNELEIQDVQVATLIEIKTHVLQDIT